MNHPPTARLGARRIVFLGPPGAGKGTQASGFARARSIPHLSTGDLLRAAVAARTPRGVEADGYMRQGKLVPDAIVLGVLQERLAQPDAARGFVLDGFPRNVAQAEELDRFATLDVAIWFEVEPRALVDRLAGRRTCPTCHRVYNVRTRPPREADRCDDDRSPLQQRPDDRPEAVAERLAVYQRETAPLLERFRQRGILVRVDALGSPEAVAARLAAVVPPA